MHFRRALRARSIELGGEGGREGGREVERGHGELGMGLARFNSQRHPSPSRVRLGPVRTSSSHCVNFVHFRFFYSALPSPPPPSPPPSLLPPPSPPSPPSPPPSASVSSSRSSLTSSFALVSSSRVGWVVGAPAVERVLKKMRTSLSDLLTKDRITEKDVFWLQAQAEGGGRGSR